MELIKIDEKTMTLQGSNDNIYKALSALKSFYTHSAEKLKLIEVVDDKELMNELFIEYSRKADEVKQLIYQYQCNMGFDPNEL